MFLMIGKNFTTYIFLRLYILYVNEVFYDSLKFLQFLMKHESWIELVIIVLSLGARQPVLARPAEKQAPLIHSIAPGAHQRLVAIMLLFKII